MVSTVIGGAEILDYNVPDSFCFTVCWFLHLLDCENARKDKIRVQLEYFQRLEE